MTLTIPTDINIVFNCKDEYGDYYKELSMLGTWVIHADRLYIEVRNADVPCSFVIPLSNVLYFTAKASSSAPA